MKITPRERKHLRDLIIDAFFHREFDSMWNLEVEKELLEDIQSDYIKTENVRNLYKDLGFLTADLRELKDSRWWIRIKALERIEDVHIPEAEDDILPLLRDKKMEVRFAALRCLASIGSEKFLLRLENIFSSTSTWSYLYLVNILLAADIPIRYIRPIAESANPFQRKAAAILLRKYDDKTAISLLTKLSEDKISEVRREAVNSLAIIGSPAAVPVFWRKLADESPQVRAAIAKGIGDMGHIIHLEKLADDENFEVRFQAFASLKKLGLLGKEVIRNYHGKYTALANEFLTGGKDA